MKSRRKLKKEIKKAFNNLYEDVIFYEIFSNQADVESARKLVDKIVNVENDLIERISVNEGKDVKGRIKTYFQKLNKDIKSNIDEITKEIAALP